MKRLIALVLIMAIICSYGGACVYGDNGKFKDVKNSDWYAEYVYKLNALKIIDGYKGKFNPTGNVTRAEFTKMLVQAMGFKKVDSLSFDDLRPFKTNKPHWASVYIETALRNGVIVKSEIGDNFYPDVPLKRIDMAEMTCRALKLQPSSGDNPFVDMVQANGYVTKVYEEYIVRGNLEGGKRLYKPEGLTSRAEATAILSRLVDYKANPEAYKKNLQNQEKYSIIPKRVFDYPVNYNGKSITSEEAHKLLYTDILYYSKLNNKTPDEMVKELLDKASEYIDIDCNVNYKTVEKTYAQRIQQLIPIDHYNIDVPKTVKYYKDNTVVQESKFYTDEKLVLSDFTSFKVRGVLKFVNHKPTSSTFLQNFYGHGKKGLAAEQWYEQDIEITFAGDAMDPTRAKLVIFSVKFLNDPIKISKP